MPPRMMSTSVWMAILLIGISSAGFFVSYHALEKPEMAPVVVKDAYCHDGEFHFTIVNRYDRDVNVSYKYVLADPKADKEARSLNGSHGDGYVELGPYERQIVINSIEDPDGSEIYEHFLVMKIRLYIDGDLVHSYRESKSDYDWDYSVLPPVRK